MYDLTSIADQLWQEQLGGKGNWINFRSMILANVSRFLTLEPGHLITTGTPEGVGPMKPGDTVTVPIKGIGMLSNPVVAEE